MTLMAFGFVAILLLAVASGSRLRAKSSGYRQTLHNYQNVQYYADFDIGGQKISGIFDTGSFELLVRSKRCSTCVHPTPPYNSLVSTSFSPNGTVTKHVFGSGPCMSMMGYETVSVGSFHAEKQAFWEIVKHRIPVLDTAKFAAIVGIGPNFAFGNTEKTLLMSYGVDEFSVCLQKPTGSVGFLTWGKVQTNLRPKDYAIAPVIGKHHWAAKLEDVTFGGPGLKRAGIPCGAQQGSCTAIVDSGTSLIAAPGAALMQLSELIPAIKEDCSNLNELPTLRFVVGGNPMELPPQAYVMRITGSSLDIDSIWDLLFFRPKIRKMHMCMPAFMQMDIPSKTGPVWILGMPFFRYYHTTFDRRDKVMRFSVAGPHCFPRPFHSNKSEILLSEHAELRSALDISVNAIVPPTLSEMIDFPLATGDLEI